MFNAEATLPLPHPTGASLLAISGRGVVASAMHLSLY